MQDTEIQTQFEAAREQALDWLLELELHGYSEAILDRHAAWLDASELNHHAWGEVMELDATLNSLENEPSNQTGNKPNPTPAELLKFPSILINSPASATKSRSYSPDKLSVLGGLIAACIAILLVGFSIPSLLVWALADYSTDVAQDRSFILEDGTKLHLSADSAVKLSFSAAERHLEILSGQAFLNVEPDQDRPFIVKAANTTTRVLGTAFDVNVMKSGVQVSVAHGRVAFRTPNSGSGQPELTREDWRVIYNDGQSREGKIDVDLIAAWRNGRLIAKDLELDDAVSQIARYYNSPIMIFSPTLAKAKITGVLNLHQPDEALSTVAIASNARILKLGFAIALY